MASWTQTIQWQPFSAKQKEYIKRAITNKMSVAEGAIRAGKTILNCIIARDFIEFSPDRIHLASGSSIANAKLNIGDCNGFGLEHQFRGRCRWGQYKDNEALIVQTKTGEKIIIFAGGGKRDSYKKILGNSYGLWIATEINEHYDSDDPKESFIKVAFGRQAAAKEQKVLWDLNPDDPDAKIYKEYIDLYKHNGLLGGYNYAHFTMQDNLSITPQRLLEIESQYVVGSMWYRRDILGERCRAEGLCLQFLADNINSYYCDYDYFSRRLQTISVGVDFGGNQSATTFCATGFTQGFRDVIVLKATRIKRSITPNELEQLFNQFCVELYAMYGLAFPVYCDSEESVLINGLKLSNARNFGRASIMNAKKTSIKGRIALENKLVASKKIWFFKNGDGVNEVVKALTSSSWDKKNIGERLDVVSYDNPIDMCDAFEYSIEPFESILIARNTI